MASLVFILFFLFLFPFSSSQTLHPNFTASNINFIDNGGTFLTSANQTFKASIFGPGAQQTTFYLCIIHSASNTVVWSANRDAPISNSGLINLTENGIFITDEDDSNGKPRWSTPVLKSRVRTLLLTDMGNLVLLDQFNVSLWESIDYPTDTIVIGQRLPVGSSLSGAVSSSNFSTGDYKLTVESSDAILQWQGLIYWKLSMDTKAFKNFNSGVEYMEVNRTGLYLIGRNGSVVVIQVSLSPSDLRLAKLDDSGKFTVSSFSGGEWKQEFLGPIDNCRIPLVCGRVGLCTDDPATAPTCSCPLGFRSHQNSNGCFPNNETLSLPVACRNKTSDSNSSDFSYLKLDYGIEYFETDFKQPVQFGLNLITCMGICSNDCSCLGVYYENSSGSCYVLQTELGSFVSSTTVDNDLLGYIKTTVGSTTETSNGNNNLRIEKHKLPLVAIVLLPFIGLFFVVLALAFFWSRRRKISKRKAVKQSITNSHSSGELDEIYIPGLPRRFKYEELELATENFKTHIGSGGFGSVYKGTLADNSVIAVKKIINLGIEGKKEFCTELAVIGNIRHVNLVILRGFCAKRQQFLLVYEYMNRGSLDRTLFGNGPVLGWQERVEIALGTARGLAYLHHGCEHKIIHCDVKPENILLHDNFQAKISDFGLSKLLTLEQSSLFTTMRGTRGYLAPEWLTNTAISEKTDVYSFGMVLLELVSGRKNCATQPQTNNISENEQEPLSSSWLRMVYYPLYALEMHEQGRYQELADPRLEGRVLGKNVEKLVKIALCCVHEEPALRPDMVSVVGMLEGGIRLAKPRIESLHFLRFYGRRFTEESMMGGEGNGMNEVVWCSRVDPSGTSSSTMSGFNASCFSNISSQQVSGPR